MSEYTYIWTLRPDNILDRIKVPTMNHIGEYDTGQLAALGLRVGYPTSTLNCLARWIFKVEQIPYPFECHHPGYQWFQVTTLVQGA